MRQQKPGGTFCRISVLACVVACGFLLSSIVAQERISVREHSGLLAQGQCAEVPRHDAAHAVRHPSLRGG
jgi:hypothetical protein